MKILTISVASYNCESTLRKCLDSMIKANYIDELEVIVVNDGSKDKTLDIAYEYQKLYPNSILVINKENGGHGSTINAAINKATGKFFKIVDSDDWVETANLDKLIDFLKKSNVDLIVNPYYEVNPENQAKKLINVAKYDFKFDKVYDYESIALNFDEPHMHKLTFRTKLVKQMGPIIDENCFYVDIEYVGFLLSRVNNICFIDYPIYDYLLGYEGQSVSITSMVKRREQHKRVVYRMLRFFEGINEQSNRREFLRRYISSLIGRQYKIYLYLPIKEGKNEFINFDKTIPKYIFTKPGMGRRILPVVKVLRCFNYRFYSTFIHAFKLFRLL